jgi:hypothetical protein
MNSVAPTSSTIVSATCNVTRTLPNDQRRSIAPLACPVSARTERGVSCVARSTDTSEQMSTVSSVSASVNSVTRQLGLTSSTIGSARVVIIAMSARAVQEPATIETAPANTAHTSDSVKNCRSRRLRPAPMASRIASSRWRPTARASSRLAAVAHATAKSSPTSASNSHNGSANCSLTRENPVSPDSSVNGRDRNLARRSSVGVVVTSSTAVRIC